MLVFYCSFCGWWQIAADVRIPNGKVTSKNDKTSTVIILLETWNSNITITTVLSLLNYKGDIILAWKSNLGIQEVGVLSTHF